MSTPDARLYEETLAGQAWWLASLTDDVDHLNENCDRYRDNAWNAEQARDRLLTENRRLLAKRDDLRTRLDTVTAERDRLDQANMALADQLDQARD